jgi:hypothetical protein
MHADVAGSTMSKEQSAILDLRGRRPSDNTYAIAADEKTVEAGEGL